MEQMEAILGFEWDSMSGICSDEADFMAQLLGNCSIPNEVPGNSLFSKVWPYHASNDSIDCERSMYHSPDETNANMFSFSQGGGGHFPFSSSHEGYYHDVSLQDFVNVDDFMSMDFCKENFDFLNQDVSSDSIESNEKKSEVVCGNNLQLVGDLVIPNMADISGGDRIGGPSGSKKRSRPSGEVPKDKRSMKLKRSVDIEDDDFDKNMKIHRLSSSSCCSENDSNASYKLDEVAPVSGSVGSEGSGPLNSNGKRRANRGSATDPQSLYARNRRERINERLRILQRLVPNGTKVDISTMLEEAVEYVKFLQLQIKLLSSDDLWMYAPIAYNGMDIGLDLKISLNPQSS